MFDLPLHLDPTTDPGPDDDSRDRRLPSRPVIDAAVPGFLPSTHGLRFKNDWPQAAAFRIDVLGLQVPVGDARHGLCGGMVFAVRDLFLLGRPMPPDTTAPSSGPLYEYIGRRLKDSFILPGGPVRYLDLMAAPDGDRNWPVIGWLLKKRTRGVAWRTINDELPEHHRGPATRRPRLPRPGVHAQRQPDRSRGEPPGARLPRRARRRRRAPVGLRPEPSRTRRRRAAPVDRQPDPGDGDRLRERFERTSAASSPRRTPRRPRPERAAHGARALLAAEVRRPALADRGDALAPVGGVLQAILLGALADHRRLGRRRASARSVSRIERDRERRRRGDLRGQRPRLGAHVARSTRWSARPMRSASAPSIRRPVYSSWRPAAGRPRAAG